MRAWLSAAQSFLSRAWVRVLLLGGIGYYMFQSATLDPDVQPDHDSSDGAPSLVGAHAAGQDQSSRGPLLLRKHEAQHQLDRQIQKMHARARDDGLASIHTVRGNTDNVVGLAVAPKICHERDRQRLEGLGEARGRGQDRVQNLDTARA